jgi:hypothetical protein
MQSFFTIDRTIENKPTIVFNPKIDNKAFALTAGFYYDTAIGPLGVFANYYDNVPRPNLRIFLHLGLLLFNKQTWD